MHYCIPDDIINSLELFSTCEPCAFRARLKFPISQKFTFIYYITNIGTWKPTLMRRL